MHLVHKALVADEGYLLEPMMRVEVTTPEVIFCVQSAHGVNIVLPLLLY